MGSIHGIKVSSSLPLTSKYSLFIQFFSFFFLAVHLWACAFPFIMRDWTEKCTTLTWLQTASTWLITDGFPNFSPNFQVRNNQRKPNVHPTQSCQMPHSLVPHPPLRHANTLQPLLLPQRFPTPVPACASLPCHVPDSHTVASSGKHTHK